MAENVEAKVKEIILEILDVDEEKITPDARFIDDLGAGSIDLVEVITAAQNEFNVDINDEQAAKLATVKDVIDFLEKNA